MFFRWVPVKNEMGNVKVWRLVHRETNLVVLEIRLSKYAETYGNWKVRKKIKRAYEWYYDKVFWNTLRFF